MAEHRGRPSKYTPEIAKLICDKIATGMTLSEICRADDMPPSTTVRQWVLDDRDGFSALYARARSLMLEVWAEQIVEISEDGTNDWVERLAYNGGNPKIELNGEHVQRSKLRVDSRKWLLSKLRPETYGDKLDHSIAGVDGKPIQHSVKVSYVDAEDKS